MAIGFTVIKPSAENCWSSCTLIGYSKHVKVMTVCLDTKLNWMWSFNLDKIWWIYDIHSWSFVVNCMEIKWIVFTRQTLDLTEVRNWKSSLQSRDAGANKFVPWIKNMSVLEKLHVDLVTSIKFGKMQHCRRVECIWTFHQQKVGRFSGLNELGCGLGGHAYARALAPWAILSISGNDDTNNPHWTFKAWSMIVALISVCDSLISSPPCHSSGLN